MQQSGSAQRAEQLMRSDWSDQENDEMMGSGDEGEGEDSYIDVAEDSHVNVSRLSQPQRFVNSFL